MDLEFLGFGEYFVLAIGVLIAPLLSMVWFFKTRSNPVSKSEV